MSSLHATLLVAVLMLLSRFTGFLREIVIAYAGGVSLESDVVIVFMTFPDMMINLLLGGGLSAALVPAFRGMLPASATALFLRASLLVGIAFGVLAASLAVGAQATLRFIAPGWSEDLVVQVSPLFRVTLIALPITALSGIVVAFLNSRERFFFGALGTIVFNIIVIAALLLMFDQSPVIAICVGILSGAGWRLAMQLSATVRFWHRPDFQAPCDHTGLLRRFAESFGFFSVLALLPPLARAFASLGEAGSLSMFNYAYKLVELPMAIIVSAIVTVLLPRLSGMILAHETERAANTLGFALRAVVILLLCTSVSTYFYGETLISIVYHGAAFSADEIGRLGVILSIGLAALPFQGVVVFYGTAFVSYERTRELVVVSALMLLTMIVLGLILQPAYSVQGVMLAYALAQVLGACILTLRMVRFTSWQPVLLALDKPLSSLALPFIVCALAAWLLHSSPLWQWVSLVLSASLFLMIHFAVDSRVLMVFVGRFRR